MPVARSYQLIRKERLQIVPTKKDAGAKGDAAAPKVRTADSNPFRTYKPEPLAYTAEDTTLGE